MLKKPSEPSYSRHPVEDLEPEIADTDAYREAARIGLRLINSAMLAILQTRMTKETATALWHVAYGIGLPLCEGRSMTETARELGVERATVSKGAKAFQRRNGLPTNQYMKDEDAVAVYSEARKGQL